MKYICFLVLASLTTVSCDLRDSGSKPDVQHQTSGEAARKDSTSVQLIDSIYNFGQVVDGEKVEYNFRFKNTGDKPLVVENTSASCGCTVPERPEQPIPPGQIGFIKVVFDSKGRPGTASKDISVTSNAYPDFPVMKLTGEVIAKK